MNNSKINGKFKGKDIISLDQFNTSDISTIFKQTKKMKQIALNAMPSKILKGNIVTLIFYEPSSRTFGSFTGAIKQLGGQTIDILDPDKFSSVTKGETFEDTIKVFEAYSDAIVLRHPVSGYCKKASTAATKVPIINAGDGTGEHPTQALLDLYTIFEHTKSLSNLTGVIAGDMLNGRTVHSLIRGLSIYKNNTLYLLSPKSLKLSKSDMDNFRKSKIKLVEITTHKDIPKNADFWYWTRVQKERFKISSDYQKVKNKFILSNKLIKEKAGKSTIFMHPLPRVGEILPEVDGDKRSVYLTSQIRNGMYLRMALIALILGK